MATALPPARRGPRRRRSSTPGCSSWTQPSAASIRPPRERGAEGPCQGVASSHSGHLRGTGPRTSNWKDPDPLRRSSRGSGGSGQGCLPGDGGYTTPAACPVSTTSWRYGPRRTGRLVTGRSHRPRSAWPDQAGLAFLAVTHRYKRTHRLWPEQFQIDSAWARSRVARVRDGCRCAGSGRFQVR
jgi:hypothetical protein